MEVSFQYTLHSFHFGTLDLINFWTIYMKIQSFDQWHCNITTRINILQINHVSFFLLKVNKEKWLVSVYKGQKSCYYLNNWGAASIRVEWKRHIRKPDLKITFPAPLLRPLKIEKPIHSWRLTLMSFNFRLENMYLQ